MLHNNALKSDVELFRKYCFGIWCFLFAFIPLNELQFLPWGLIRPVGIFIWPTPFWTEPATLWCIRIGGTILSAFVLLNILPRASSVLFCFLAIIQQGLMRSMGFINHAEIGLLLSCICITGFDWINDYHERHGPHKDGFNIYGFTLQVNALIILLGYVFISAHRLIYSGIEIFFSDTLLSWIVLRSNEITDFTFYADEWILQHPWLIVPLNFGFFITTLFEISAPLSLVFKTYRKIFLIVLLCFHISTWFLMGILFWENIALYILLVDTTIWRAGITKFQKKYAALKTFFLSSRI